METRLVDRIRAIIAEQLRIDVARVTPAALLAADLGADDLNRLIIADLGADDLDRLIIMMDVETALEIEITSGAEDGIATVGDLMDVVAAILAGEIRIEHGPG